MQGCAKKIKNQKKNEKKRLPVKIFCGQKIDFQGLYKKNSEAD